MYDIRDVNELYMTYLYDVYMSLTTTLWRNRNRDFDVIVIAGAAITRNIFYIVLYICIYIHFG